MGPSTPSTGSATLTVRRWIHSDLTPSILLVCGERLTGVLDFGTVRVDDLLATSPQRCQLTDRLLRGLVFTSAEGGRIRGHGVDLPRLPPGTVYPYLVLLGVAAGRAVL